MKKAFFLASSFSLSLSISSATTTLNASLEYNFLFTAESCQSGFFLNDSNTSPSNNIFLHRNDLLTECAPSTLGVTTNAATETTTDSDTNNTTWFVAATNQHSNSSYPLQKVANKSSGISFELWFETKPREKSNKLQTILVVGKNLTITNSSNNDGNMPALSLCSQADVDFVLAQQGDDLVVFYRTSDVYFEPCQMYRLGSLRITTETANNDLRSNHTSTSLNHVIVSLTNKRQQFIVNGKALAFLKQPFPNTLSHWQPNYNLFLFSHPLSLARGSTTFWTGTIYKLSIYSGSLSLDDAQSLLIEGLPWTPDYAIFETITMNEDAEPGVAGSHQPNWYRQSPSVPEAQAIYLKIGSLEQKLRDLALFANVTFSRAAASNHIYITSLPKRGCLYLQFGKSLGCNVTEQNNILLTEVRNKNQSVVYLPDLNAHSEISDETNGLLPFSNFSYCVTTSPILSAHQCQSATVSIIVEPVNDPPIAAAVKGPVVVTEGLVRNDSPIIQLTGTDVDVHDFIDKVEITVHPSRGYLTLFVGRFRSDTLLHGAHLSELNWTVSHGDDSVYLQYVYDPGEFDDLVVMDNDVTDFFQFRVADSHGTWSIEESVDVQIISALSAIAPKTVWLAEDANVTGNLFWYGNDTTGYQRRIGYIIESVPSPAVGVLMNADTQEIIHSGHISKQFDSFPYSTGWPITFLPHPDYCTQKATTLEESNLRFRVVGYGSDNTTVVSLSSVYTQSLIVTCKLDELVLSGPTSVLSANRLSLHRMVENLEATKAFVRGITVQTKDAGSGRLAQVVVWSGSSFLTFRQDAWKKVIPIHGRNSFQQGNVTFLARPEELNDVFEDMYIQSYETGEFDITILIKYGDCQDENQTSQAEAVRTDSCQLLRHNILVTFENGGVDKINSLLLSWRFILTSSGATFGLFFFLLAYSGIEYWLISRHNDDSADVPLWKQLYNAENGMFYYLNTDTGDVTYQPPINEEYIAWDEEKQES